MSPETSTVGRRKVRYACDQCRLQKRACNGKQPCSTCLRYEYACEYAPRSKKPIPPRATIAAVVERRVAPAQMLLSPATSLGGDDSDGIPTGHTFAQGLSHQLSSDHAVPISAWNLGIREAAFRTNIQDLVSLEDAHRFSEVFFQKIGTIYSVVDQGYFFEALNLRWNTNQGDFTGTDAITCGAIALGSLFSGSNALDHEVGIFELAKTLLESSNTDLSKPRASLDMAAAWILRVLYLRMAVNPYAAWAASRACVDFIENNTVCEITNGDDGLSRRLAKVHWLARLLHSCISNEYSPPRHRYRQLADISCPPPSSQDDLASFLIQVYLISNRLETIAKSKCMSELTEILVDIDAFDTRGDAALQLHKSNHAFCVYRLMRLTSFTIPEKTLLLIIAIAKPGLDAAEQLAADQQPWWHLCNVPFQNLCVLLSMDTRESLSQIEPTMKTIRRILHCFPTARMGKVLASAEGLVKMCQQKKFEAAHMLGRSTVPDSNSDSRSPYDSISPDPAPPSHPNFIVDDFPSFDWDTFMQMEFPMDLGDVVT